MLEFNPFDWFWIVGGDESRVWSSKQEAYVPPTPSGVGLTRIANEAELTDVLGVYGLPGPLAVFPDLTSRQLWTALATMGHYEEVDAAIAALPLVDRVEAQKATTFQRYHPLIVRLSPILGLTEEQIDDVWMWGATL